MKRVVCALVALGLAAQQEQRPIPARASYWTEELTHLEVRDAIRAGKTTVIIGTGGVEQNGPYVATGKHNYVLQLVMPVIAKKLGNALLAPIVRFVPEGEVGPPPTGHMRYAGTISVREETFRRLLSDICESYATHGFQEIVLLGDSGGNQKGMAAVAAEWNRKKSSTRVYYVREFYEEDPWSYQFLLKKGIVQIDRTPPQGEKADRPAHTRNGIHDDIYYEAQIAAVDPNLIRVEERRKAGQFHLHGVNLEPLEKTVELGHALAEYRAGIVVRAIEKARRSR
jgi:hypothetical protein